MIFSQNQNQLGFAEPSPDVDVAQSLQENLTYYSHSDASTSSEKPSTSYKSTCPPQTAYLANHKPASYTSTNQVLPQPVNYDFASNKQDSSVNQSSDPINDNKPFQDNYPAFSSSESVDIRSLRHHKCVQNESMLPDSTRNGILKIPSPSTSAVDNELRLGRRRKSVNFSEKMDMRMYELSEEEKVGRLHCDAAITSFFWF